MRWRTAKPARRASAGGASQTAIAGRDPPHEAAAGPCASRSAGRAAQTRCAQTWAALRPRRPAMLGSLYGSNVKDWKPKPKPRPRRAPEPQRTLELNHPSRRTLPRTMPKGNAHRRVPARPLQPPASPYHSGRTRIRPSPTGTIVLRARKKPRGCAALSDGPNPQRCAIAGRRSRRSQSSISCFS